ncbi:Protein artichoke [Gryllus bimaculatus]|nr:Protein artichoke [Gryllus bimaculatus]
MKSQCLIFTLLLLVHAGMNQTFKCPYFCSCDKWEGLKRITCTGQRLANSDINAPPQVQVLDLSTNSISELRDKGFFHNHHLKYLNVSHNKITDIHTNAFYGLTKLNILDLRHNHLKFLIPKAFEETPMLQELYLSGNEIGHFGKPPVFNIPSLQLLHMKECWLDRIDELTFSLLPNLMDLDLSDNQFVFLKIEYLRSLEQLNTFDITGNPWHCNDEIQEVLEELRERNVKVTSICEVDSRMEITINGSMFDRIVVGDYSDSYEDSEEIETWGKDISDFWYEDGDPVETNPAENNEESNVKYTVHDLMGQIPALWAFILGLQIGVVVAVLGMWVWLRCKCSQVPAQPPIRIRSRSLSQSLRRSVGRRRSDSNYTELESVDCPGTPPPPYRDVALNTFR